MLLSLCPQVFGMYVIKLAVAMVLAGGVQRTDSSGTKIRGRCKKLHQMKTIQLISALVSGKTVSEPRF